MPVFPLGNGYENISYRVRSMIIIRTKCFEYHTNYRDMTMDTEFTPFLLISHE